MKRWHVHRSDAEELRDMNWMTVFVADRYPGCTDLDCTEQHVAVVPWDEYLAMREVMVKEERIKALIERHRGVLQMLADYDAT